MAKAPVCLFLVIGVFPQDSDSFDPTIISNRDPDRFDYVEVLTTDPAMIDLDRQPAVLVPPRQGINIRYASSLKGLLPDNAPWLVLASDKFGNIYEGVLPRCGS